MALHKLNIAILSTCSKPGDVQGNIAQICEFAYKAKAMQCDVMLTPELSASGYGGYAEVLQTAETAGGTIYKQLSEIASKCSLVLLAGFVEKNGDKCHIAHYIIYPDKSYKVQRKHRATPAESPLAPAKPLYFDDTEEIGHINASDANFTFFEINSVKCAIAICADLGVKNLQQFLSDNSVKALFIPVGAGGCKENKVTNIELATEEGKKKYIKLCDNEYFFPRSSIAESLKYKCAMIAVNMCGYDGKNMYHGGSGSVVSHFGEISAYLPSMENIDRQRPSIAFGEIDFSQSL